MLWPFFGKRRAWPLVLALVALLGLAPAPAQARPGAEESKAFLASLVSQAALALHSEGGVASRELSFRGLLSEGFHMPLIARIALGEHWRKTTDAQRQNYIALFSAFVLKTYGPHLGSFEPANFLVIDAIEKGKVDRLVRTQIAQNNGPPLEAGWRIRMVNGTPKIVDVVVGGVSMTLTQRREFQSIMRRDGID
ncbi:MAG: ABC transporter substrate-binding protein, partial [Chromatiales bacterium]|nr:ABC transporter substrate-binding protein [Chromatiales bacterium]